MPYKNIVALHLVGNFYALKKEAMEKTGILTKLCSFRIIYKKKNKQTNKQSRYKGQP